jgi:hypothetical protein
MRVGQAKRLKELEIENSRLKKLMAYISPDNSILILKSFAILNKPCCID